MRRALSTSARVGIGQFMGAIAGKLGTETAMCLRIRAECKRQRSAYFVMVNRSTSAPSAATWRTVRVVPSTSATVSEWTFEMNLCVNDCHEARVILLLRVIERVAAGAGDKVNHPAGPGVVVAVKHAIECPSGPGTLFCVAHRLAVGSLRRIRKRRGNVR